MKKTIFMKLLSLVLCVVLVTAMALLLVGCRDALNDENVGSDTLSQSVTELGQGERSFVFVVVDIDGNKTQFVINTDKETVGEALIEHELIEGDEGPFGLYVKKVNGIEADYDKDKTYWSLFINGEYATSGVDTTDIVNGTTYTLKVMK